MGSKTWTPKQLELLAKLHGKMGSTNSNESEQARKHILKMLIDHDCSWNDVMGLLQLAQQAQQAKAPPPPPSPSPPGESATALELYETIRAVYENHLTSRRRRLHGLPVVGDAQPRLPPVHAHAAAAL